MLILSGMNGHRSFMMFLTNMHLSVVYTGNDRALTGFARGQPRAQLRRLQNVR